MTVPVAAYEALDRERRALMMECETYRDCIGDAGGLEALRALCVEQVPVHPQSPPTLAAWKAFCEAGGLDGGPLRLPWVEVESRQPLGSSARRRVAYPDSDVEAPPGASRRFGVAA